LTVLTIDHESRSAQEIQKPARQYLEKNQIPANFILHESGPRAEIILNTAKDQQNDLILIGGYKASPVLEVVLGSVVDEVLRKSRIPVMICR